MAISFQQLRAQNPEFDGYNDSHFLEIISEHAGMPIDELAALTGYSAPQPVEEKAPEPEDSFLDKAISTVSSAATGGGLRKLLSNDGEQSDVRDLLGSAYRGAKQTGRMIGASADTVTGDLPGVEGFAKDSAIAHEEDTPQAQRKLLDELQAIDRDDSVTSQIGQTLSAAGRNKMGTAQLVKEQLPNTAVSLGAGYAGFKTGAATGAAIGSVFPGAGTAAGASVGGVLGFLGGMFLGNSILEIGGKAMEKGQDGFTEDERKEAIKEGSIKGGVITGVDAATLGIGGKVAKTLSGAARQAGARAEAKVLMDAGVNMTNVATINAALKTSPELVKAAKLAGEKAAMGAISKSRKATIAGTGLAMETVGEGAGEYLGELAATGEADVVDATIESIAGMSQSAIETAYNYNKVASQVTQADVVKAASQVNQAQTQQGVDNIAQAETIDEAINAATEATSQPTVSSRDVWDNIQAKDDLLARAEAEGIVNQAVESELSNTPQEQATINPETLSPVNDTVVPNEPIEGLESNPNDLSIDDAAIPEDAFEDEDIDTIGRVGEFAGKLAKTADNRKLGTAKRMESKGSHPALILEKTGWSKGIDGKWRFEIDDSKSSLTDSVSDKGSWMDEFPKVAAEKGKIQDGREQIKLTDLLSHDDLYSAYPHLRDLTVHLRKGAGGMHRYTKDGREEIYIGGAVRMDNVKSVLLHEIQHSIQRKEGFALGGSPVDFDGMSMGKSIVDQVNNDLEKLQEQIIKDAANISNAAKEGDQQAIEFIKKAQSDFDLGWGATDRDYAERGLVQISNSDEMIEAKGRGQKMVDKATDEYKRLAGEIEARNTQSRMNLSAKDRLNIEPKDTQDTPSKDAIVRLEKEGNEAERINYEKITQRPNTTEDQRVQGRLAFRDFVRNFNRRSKGRIVASSIPKDFEERAGSALIGQKVESAGDLAAAAQVLRDPRFETFRVLYVKDGRIIHHTGVTSRMPGSVEVVIPMEGETKANAWKRYNKNISDTMKKTGADGYYMLHNHPSGNADPSEADISLTKKVQANVPGLIAHVVINSNEYSVFGGENSLIPQVIKKELTGGYGKDATIPHKALNKKINNFGDIAEVGKLVQRKDGFFTIIGTNAKAEVVSIAEVPLSVLEKSKMMQLAMLRSFARNSGAPGVSVVVDKKHMGKFHDAAFDDIITAVVTPEGESSPLSSGKQELFEKGKKRGIGVEEKKDTPNDSPDPKGTPISEIEDSIRELREKWPGNNIRVVQSVSGLSKFIPKSAVVQLPKDVDGIYDANKGEVYLIADNIPFAERAKWIAIHEVIGHGGLRKMDSNVKYSLELAGGNTFIKKLSHAIAKKRGDVWNKELHTEEAIAELAAASLSNDTIGLFYRYGIEVPRDSHKPLEMAIDRVIEAIKRFLGKIFNTTTNQEIKELIDAARIAVERGGLPQTEEFIRRSLAIARKGYRTIDSFVIPEMEEYADNMTGDLSYIRGTSAVPGGPLRVKIGEATGDHLGTGLLHMVDNAIKAPKRMNVKTEKDVAENVMRGAVATMKGVREVYKEKNVYIMVDPKAKRAIVTKFEEGYHSVITERPHNEDSRQRYGSPRWSGRLAFPSQSSSATAPSKPLPGDKQGIPTQAVSRPLSDANTSNPSGSSNDTRPSRSGHGLDASRRKIIVSKKGELVSPQDDIKLSVGENLSRSRGYPQSASEPIFAFKTADKLKLHKDYRAAKSGDHVSAMNLVRDLVPQENIDAARKQFGSDVIYLPVVLREQDGANRIPHALSVLYAASTNAEISSSVFEQEKAFHTGMKMMERLVSRASFEGKIEPGKRYVLVDDVTTSGATLSDLASFVQENGGEVAGSVLLTNAMRSGTIFPVQKTINRLEVQYGNTIREVFGISPAALTKEESQYLLGFRTDDELRNSAAKARNSRSERILSKNVSKPEDSLRFSRADTLSAAGVTSQPQSETSSLPKETKTEAFRRRTQDAMLRFKVVQNWLKDQGVNITEAANVYQRENISKGKMANKIEDFREKELKPLIKKIAETSKRAGRDGKFDLEDIVTYLEALHIPEANEKMRQIHKKADATANGITDDQARQVVSDFSLMPNFAEFDSLASEVRAIGHQTLDMRLAAGLVSQEQYDNYKRSYSQWVPLRGNIEQKGFGKGLSVTSKDKRRLGHSLRDSEMILENLVVDRERAIMEIEKNKVALTLAQFLLEAKNEEIGTVGKPEKLRTIQDHAYAVKYQGRVMGSYQKKTDADNAVRQALKKQGDIRIEGESLSDADFAVDKVYDPSVIMSAKPTLADNEVQAYVNGHSIRMQVNDETMARAATAAGIEQVGALLQGARMFNTFLSRAYTAWSPDFTFMNMARDAGSGSIVLTGKKGALFTAKTFANYGFAIKELAKSRNDPSKSQWVQRYRDAGGNIGAAYLDDLERVGTNALNTLHEFAGARETYRMVYNEEVTKGSSAAKARTKAAMKAGIAKTKSIKMISGVFGFIENLNKVVENSLRLAAFKTAIENGDSEQDAASLSKDLMNFNRKGEVANTMGAWYLFFNPGMQGAHIVGEALTSSKHKGQAWALLGAMASLSFVLAELARGDDEDEWENIPEHVKDRNLIFKIGDTQATVPIPYGFGAFISMGRLMSDFNHGADADEISLKMASTVIDNFSVFGNPIVEDGETFELRPLQIMPTIPKILMGPGENVDGLGRQIQPHKYRDSQLDSQNMTRAVRNTVYEDLAHYLNDVTGGNEYEPGRVDISPNTIRYWVTSLTGGAGRFVSDSVTGAMDATEGMAPELENTPILRKFIRKPGVTDSRGGFWEAKKEVERASDRFKKAVADGDVFRSQKMLDDNGDIIALLEYSKDQTKMASEFRDEVQRIQEDENLTKKEKRLRIKDMEIGEQQAYDDFLEIFRDKKKLQRK